MAVYQWNGSDVTAAIKQLKSEKEGLEKELSFVKQNKKMVLSAFEGDAAKQFQANLEADIENVQTIIQQLDSEIAALRKVSSDCFVRCEDEVKSMVTHLRSNLV